MLKNIQISFLVNEFISYSISQACIYLSDLYTID